MDSDLTVYNILSNSNINTPLFYKISAAWSNHEGSLLLWCWLLSVFGFFFCYSLAAQRSVSEKHLSSHTQINKWHNTQQNTQSLTVYICVSLCFTLFLLATSNPFLRIPFLSVHSIVELNPVLQDPVLAIHPPLIYAGYVASAVAFSISLSTTRKDSNALSLLRYNLHSLQRHVSTNYSVQHYSNGPQHLLRIWILLCWCFLTVGILLGSWWAYHELGWGGWWFWDPVENASLMPWLLATACIHSVLIPKLKSWTLLLGLSTFIFSILGTFFVRSGLLASVHSFAADSTRGLCLLWFLAAILLVSALSIVRWHWRKNHNTILRTQREQTMLLQAASFCIICLLVLCGTMAPILFQLWFNRDVSTGPAFFHATIIPLFGSMIFVMIYAHFIQLHLLLCFAIDFTLITVSHALLFYFVTNMACLESMFAAVCFALFCSILLFQIRSCPDRSSIFHNPFNSRLVAISNRIKTIALSMRLSHTGMIVFILGILLSYRNKTQLTQIMHCGELVQLNNRFYSLRSIDQNYGPTYHSICGNIGVYLRAPQKEKGLLSFVSNNTTLLSETDQTNSSLLLKHNWLWDPYVATQRQKIFDQSTFPVTKFHKDHSYACEQSVGAIAHCSTTQPKQAMLMINPCQSSLHLQLCMFPEKRFPLSNQQLTTTKVAIHTNVLSDLYALIGTGNMQAGWYTTIMQLPFIGFIWIGFALATCGGLCSLITMLYRHKLHWL